MAVNARTQVSIAIEIFYVVPKSDKCFTVLSNYVEE
jgi:hypothetical protein